MWPYNPSILGLVNRYCLLCNLFAVVALLLCINGILVYFTSGHCDTIDFFFTTDLGFGNGYLGKQSVAQRNVVLSTGKKELEENMDRCIGHCSIAEKMLKVA